MANFTENYQLKKPIQGEFYDVADQNGNMDIIDQELKNREQGQTDADKAIAALENPVFEDYTGGTTVPDAATAINNIKSKGKLSTILSNVKAAFKGACLIGQIVNNCVTNRPDLPGSAAQLKVLMDLYTSLNNNLAGKIYSSGNDLLVTRADDDSGIKYRLISSKSGLKLNKYVNDVGSTLWEVATTADLSTKVNKADNHNIAIGYDAAKKALSVTLDGVYIGNCTIAK